MADSDSSLLRAAKRYRNSVLCNSTDLSVGKWLDAEIERAESNAIVIDCTYTLLEVKTMGWLPPGIASKLREVVEEGNPWPPEQDYVRRLLDVGVPGPDAAVIRDIMVDGVLYFNAEDVRRWNTSAASHQHEVRAWEADLDSALARVAQLESALRGVAAAPLEGSSLTFVRDKETPKNGLVKFSAPALAPKAGLTITVRIWEALGSPDVLAPTTITGAVGLCPHGFDTPDVEFCPECDGF